MISNIPIYRAKKIDSDEYVEGYLVSNLVSNSNGMPPEVYYNIQNGLFYKYRIDPTTLAIHFPDMLDSQGNKIFASLQEDGRGGDILQSRGYKSPCIFNKGFTVRTVFGVCNFYMLADRLKVIGIQE